MSIQMNIFENHYLIIKIRFDFSQYINAIDWNRFDSNNTNDFNSIYGIINGLINECKNRADFDQSFRPYYEQILLRYNSQPILLFDAIKQCLNSEMQNFQQNVSQTNQIMYGNSIPSATVPDVIIQTNDINYEQKLIDIKSDIYGTKTKLNKILQFSKYSKEQHFSEENFDFFNKSCNEYIDKQNMIIKDLIIMNDYAIKELIAWKYTQKNSIIDGNLEKQNILKIQNLFSNLLSVYDYVEKSIINFMQCFQQIDNQEMIHTIKSMIEEINGLIEKLVNQSLVVEEQPNSLQKTQSKDSNNKSIHYKLIIITKPYKFETKIRFLLSEIFDINQKYPDLKIDVKVLGQQELDLLKSNGIQSFIKESKVFCEIRNIKHNRILKNKHEFSVTFNELSIDSRPERKSHLLVSEEKFVLMFVMRINIFGRLFTIYTLSLPVVIVSKKDVLSMATILWDNGFSDNERDLGSALKAPEEVHWLKLVQILSRKLFSETGKGLDEEHLPFLYSMMTGLQKCEYSPDSMITWSQFSKDKLPNRPFTFCHWFHAVIALLKEPILRDVWRMGFIMGFISSEEWTKKLIDCPNQTFLLRFSESVLGSITINYKDITGRMIKLAPTSAKDLELLSLPSRILSLDEIQFLYPNIPKEDIFKDFVSEDNNTVERIPQTPFEYVRPLMGIFVRKNSKTLPELHEMDLDEIDFDSNDQFEHL